MTVNNHKFIQHVLGGAQYFGKLQTAIIPAGTVLLRMVRGEHGFTVKAVPVTTVKDLQVTIRETFIEEISWDALETQEGDEAEDGREPAEPAAGPDPG